MKESIKLELLKRQPIHAEGFVCIDLTDPITGKVKERVSGKNLVFTDSLLSGAGGAWQDRISNCWMCLNDSEIAINANIPYLLGQTIGYGRPSQGSLGNYRGAYNLANQVLAATDFTKTRWKFQYDFTTPQANGTIRQVGLTTQYARGTAYVPLSRYPMYQNTSYGQRTNDGRYCYEINNSTGIITIYDYLTNTTSTVDVSAIVGTNSNEYKTVGYAPATGKYYIFRYSSTGANKNMYKFSDNTFTTFENTYTQTNNSISSSALMYGYPLYISGNYAYYLCGLTQLFRWDFVNNIVQTTIDLTSYYSVAAYNEYSSNTMYALYGGTAPLGNNYIFMSGGSSYNTNNRGIIYDIANNTVVGYISSYYPGSSVLAVIKYPLTTPNYICFGSAGHNAALTAYQLPVPVTKTSANGMTATYELEVYW